MTMLTVFTPTYNRAYRLPKLYESLLSQTDKNFEWLVVDDGSTDGTEELLCKWLTAESGFEIRYFKQPNGGKHRAVNRGVQLARGEYFFVVDSDDYVPPDAVRLLNAWSATIDKPECFAGISGLKIWENGEIFGGSPRVGDSGYVDATNFERDKYDLGSEKGEAYRTEVLKRFPFPEFEGEKFVSEGVLGMGTARAGLKIRWFNEPVCICEYLPDGLTAQGANQFEGHLKNPRGYLHQMRLQCRCGAVKSRIIAIHSYGEVGAALGKTKAQVAGELGVPLWLCEIIDLGYAARNRLFPKRSCE